MGRDRSRFTNRGYGEYVGTSTCIIGITPSVNLVPGVCGVVQGSVHPKRTGIEAGLSAVGDIFNAIATRAGTDVATLSKGLEKYQPGQTGLLRITWDNGDRTVIVNPNYVESRWVGFAEHCTG